VRGQVAIVDYGMGNSASVAEAVRSCGGTPVITADPARLAAARALIIPGVGSFPFAMTRLHESGLAACLTDLALGRGMPVLGICLGMQLLAEFGTEGGTTAGLGWVPGRVLRLEPADRAERVPHVGWNVVRLAGDSPLLEGLPADGDFYFVHSYHLAPATDAVVLGRTDYAGGFCSIVGIGNIFGVQFHPEKSQKLGLRLIQNFLNV
jgi:imidazole glycerol-phosphate synthase subunit HisH